MDDQQPQDLPERIAADVQAIRAATESTARIVRDIRAIALLWAALLVIGVVLFASKGCQ